MNLPWKHLALGLAACLAIATPLWAQQANDKPLRIVVPFAPGGAQDVIARYLGAKLTDKLGGSVIVDNKAGAGGIVAADAIAKATDGATGLLATGGAITIAPHLQSRLPYDPMHDLAPVALVGDTPMTIAVQAVGASALPNASTAQAIELCTALFGGGLFAQENTLASALANVNPQSHGPLAVFNWTRIEHAENWPQYHCLTPGVARAIEALDLERRAVAQAFGIELGPIEEHFSRSFSTASARLEDIAAELHAKRGGPPGPVRTDTRYVSEDMPYGLAFVEALGRIAGVPTPAYDAAAAAAGKTGSPRLSISRLAQAKSATEWTRSRISSSVSPTSLSIRTSSADTLPGSAPSRIENSTMAFSRGVVPAEAGSSNTWEITSLRLASCSKRWACTEAQYTQPLTRDSTVAPSSRSARGMPPGANMIALKAMERCSSISG